MNETDPETSVTRIGHTQPFDAEGRPAGPAFASSYVDLDADGRPIAARHVDANGRIRRRKTFGPGGSVLTDTHFDADGALSQHVVYRYDAAGRRSEKLLYLRDNHLHGRWVAERDAAGRLLRDTWRNSRDEVEVVDEYAYAENGRVVTQTRGNVAAWTCEHDADGRLLRRAGGYFSDDDATDTRFEYDAAGRLVRETATAAAGRPSSVTTYTYREKGDAE